MIRFAGVCKSFGSGATEVAVLKELTLHIPSRQFCTLMGPSGSGKSTALHLVAGLTRVSSGEIQLDDRPISTLTEPEYALLRRRELGFVFQFFHLIPYLSAEENVALPLILDGHAATGIRQRTERVLALVGMLERRRHKPTQLSGGQMQRVAIARALVAGPRLLLADEPTGNLDSAASTAIMHLLKRTNEELGVTVLMVTHDPVCASYGHRVVRLMDGRIVEDIDVSDAAPPLRQAVGETHH
jgi:putative ABC transport system ATP-binding protein